MEEFEVVEDGEERQIGICVAAEFSCPVLHNLDSTSTAYATRYFKFPSFVYNPSLNPFLMTALLV